MGIEGEAASQAGRMNPKVSVDSKINESPGTENRDQRTLANGQRLVGNFSVIMLA
jgi:hypothetical protein